MIKAIIIDDEINTQSLLNKPLYRFFNLTHGEKLPVSFRKEDEFINANLQNY